MDEDIGRKDVFLQSLKRCTASDDFIIAFYNRFLSTSDEIRWMFRNTNFERQNRLLIKSLTLVASATCGDPEGLRELRERAETHDRRHLNIRPELYDLWLSSVIETAREHDRQWNDEIEDAWRHILHYAVDYLIRHY